jgi:hypothetical protein
LVMPTNPFHREFEHALISTFWYQVEIVISAVKHIDTARIARIGVEHFVLTILVEDADAHEFGHGIWHNLIVIERLATGDLLGRERNLIVEVEIAFVSCKLRASQGVLGKLQ